MTDAHVLSLGGDPFTIGRARYEDYPPTGKTTDPRGARIWVRVRPSGGGGEFYAALDTGSDFCIMGSERARELGMGPADQVVNLRTAYGVMNCPMHRLDLTLLAEQGLNLDVQATFAIGEEGIWPPGLVLLGYVGMLERIRIGLDPPRNHVYFGYV